MVAKLMIVTAVPFHTSRLQAALSRNIVRKTSELSKIERQDNNNSNDPPKKKMRSLTSEEKVHARRLRNKTAAQVSRDRVKFRKDILEQQLCQLQYEKMKLLLENNSLQKENMKLEEENHNLKHSVQNLYGSSQVKESSIVEAAFRHAWFVNIPLQKEWVLPKVFFILMVSMWQTLMNKLLIQNYWSPSICIQKSFSNCMKSLLILVCRPWQLMIPHAQHLMIVNG